MPEKMETEFREVPHGVLYLERVERRQEWVR